MSRPRKTRCRLLHAGAGAVLAALVALAGCQQKMADQPCYKPLDPSGDSSHGLSARAPAPGTVARGHLHTDWALFTGRAAPPIVPTTQTGSGDSQTNGSGAAAGGDRPTGAAEVSAAQLAQYKDVVDEFPMPVTREFVEHGQQRFMIYCAVCHDPLGTGDGKIVERGYTRPPSYHIDRLRSAPVGHFFRVISQGYGSMPSYGSQIPVSDRWAIVAYIRALQLSQHVPEGDVTAEEREKWQRAATADEPSTTAPSAEATRP